MNLTLLEVDRYDTQNLPRLLLELLQFSYLMFVQRCLSRRTSIFDHKTVNKGMSAIRTVIFETCIKKCWKLIHGLPIDCYLFAV